MQRLQSKLEALRELVAAEPEQSQKIKKAMEEVRNVSKPAQIWGDSLWWRLFLSFEPMCADDRGAGPGESGFGGHTEEN